MRAAGEDLMDTIDRMRFVCQLVDAKLLSPSDGIAVLHAPPETFIAALRSLGLVVEERES